MADFTPAEWEKINTLMHSKGTRFGLPARRRKSIVLGSFNIRKLGQVANKSEGAWEFLTFVSKRYDLLAVQEVQDKLEGVRELQSRMGPWFRLVVSDTTGNYPGEGTSPERLAYLYNHNRVRRGEVASDITYDRSKVIKSLNTNRTEFWDAFTDLDQRLSEWEDKAAANRAAGKRAPAKPVIHLPRFVTFIRQPHCVAFEVGSRRSQNPYQFLTVNVHLLYGKYSDERRMEFEAIIGWLIERAKKQELMYYPNILFMGDCNLDFKNPEKQRPLIDAYLKSLNRAEGLEGDNDNAVINFPFLDIHPGQEEVFRTAARLKDTYDQIALVFRDDRLPNYKQNRVAGQTKDSFDFGVFNFVELFAQAVLGQSYHDLTKSEKQAFIRRFEHDVTDHLPIWIRLPMPD